MGAKGLVWSASAMGMLLNEGIGDTIRVSLTPRPGGDRRDEVYAACELLQALGLAIVCAERDRVSRLRPHDEHDVPGARRSAFRATSATACREWKQQYEGVEDAHPGGHGLRRQRSGRVEGGQHRHLAAWHR